MGNTEMVPIEKKIEGFLKPLSPALAKYAERKYPMDRFLRSANLAIMSNKDLKAAVQTNQGKQSLMDSLRYAAATGLSLNPQEGKACLIAYGDKVQYQIMKNGLVQLALETEKVEFITGEIVRENDTFRITKNMSGDNYDHSIALSERGKIIGFYSAMKLTEGGQHVIYMSRQEMEEHRDRYAKGLYHNYTDNKKGIKKGDPRPDHAWHKSFEGQGIKTVIKRLLTRVSIAEDNTFEEMTRFDDMVSGAEPENISDRFDDVAEKVDIEPEIKDVTPEPEVKAEVEPEVKKNQTPEMDIF